MSREDLNLHENRGIDEYPIEVDWNHLCLELKAYQFLQRLADSCGTKYSIRDMSYSDSFPEPQVARNHPLLLYKLQKFHPEKIENTISCLKKRTFSFEKQNDILHLHAKFIPESLFNLAFLFGGDNWAEYQWEIAAARIEKIFQHFDEDFKCDSSQELPVLMDIILPKSGRNLQVPIIDK